MFVIPEQPCFPQAVFSYLQKGNDMDTRIAAISIIVTDPESTEQLNALLHEYRNYIIGRMGIPYREKGVSIISIAIDAPMNAINSLTGKLGRLNGVHAKATCA